MIPLKTKNNSPDRIALQVELAGIFKDHSSEFLAKHPTGFDERKVIRDIVSCRTPALGGHMDICETGCGFVRLFFNSCRNRHCPKCQSLNKIRWLDNRAQKQLPTKYFHIVVTVPHELNPLALRNKRLFYDLLFKASAQSLLQLAKTWPRLQALPAVTAILHTWSQDLGYHVHLHLICSAGGLSLDGIKWIASSRKFLVHKDSLAKIIRAKILDGLKKAYKGNKLTLAGSTQYLNNPPAFYKLTRKLRSKRWILRIKPPFSNQKNLFSYLGHYTHRVAISNQRLLAADPSGVTFRVRNNQRPGTHKQLKLPAMEFMRRFLTHVLPPGYTRIRHYGLLSPKHANTSLELARALIEKISTNEPPAAPKSAETWQQLLEKVTGFDVTRCPQCGGNLKSASLNAFLNNIGKLLLCGPLWDTS